MTTVGLGVEPHEQPTGIDAGPPRSRLGVVVAVTLLAAVAFVVGDLWEGPLDRVPGEDSVDVGFLRDMIDHHDQAVQMALIQIANGESELLAGFALDVVASQRYEIGLMEARLRDWGHGRGDPTREAMAWMGHATAVADMPGMASSEDIAAFAGVAGSDADARFIQLMTDHHEGGIHMAEHAWRHAGHEPVRELAERMAKLQRIEIRDLEVAGMGLASTEVG